MARGPLPQIYKKRVKLPIFDASNVHSRAFGFVFVPVYRCFPTIYRAKKRNTKKKSANFVAKVPVKRRKTGSFSAKAAYLRTPLGFPPSELPFHGPAAPRFLRPRSHVCPISPHHRLPVRAVFRSRLTLPREMLLPFPLGRTFVWHCTPEGPKALRSQTATAEERSA